MANVHYALLLRAMATDHASDLGESTRAPKPPGAQVSFLNLNKCDRSVLVSCHRLERRSSIFWAEPQLSAWPGIVAEPCPPVSTDVAPKSRPSDRRRFVVILAGVDKPGDVLDRLMTVSLPTDSEDSRHAV